MMMMIYDYDNDDIFVIVMMMMMVMMIMMMIITKRPVVEALKRGRYLNMYHYLYFLFKLLTYKVMYLYSCTQICSYRYEYTYTYALPRIQ
jgi:hypothetical protein